MSNKKKQLKRIWYYILLFSLFLTLFAFLIKPTYAYKFSLPDFVKNAELENQVTVYDEKKWEDHLGKGSYGPNDYFKGDADEVGAKSKDKVLNWEEDEKKIAFIEDRILAREIEVKGAPRISDFSSALDYICESINGLVLYGGEAPAVLSAWKGTEETNEVGGYANYAHENGTIAVLMCQQYNLSNSYFNDKYGKKYEGTILERDHWDYNTEDFEQDPDLKKDKVPIFKDPKAWYENYKLVISIKNELLSKVGEIISAIKDFDQVIAKYKIYDYSNWLIANKSCGEAVLTNIYINELPPIESGGDDILHYVLDSALNPTGENFLQIQLGGRTGLFSVETEIGANIPEKFGFLYQILLEGIPIYSPGDKYLVNAVEEFDIDSDYSEKGIPGLHPELSIYGDIEIDGKTVTLKFRYPEGTTDPDDPDNELEDFEVVFTYNDLGVQETVIFKDGDDVFYKKESVISNAVILGFPVWAIAVGGIGAIAAITVLTYIVIRKTKKKRQNKK